MVYYYIIVKNQFLVISFFLRMSTVFSVHQCRAVQIMTEAKYFNSVIDFRRKSAWVTQ